MTTNPKTLLTPELKVITEALYSQLMSVMGLRHHNWLTRFLHPIFSFPAQRMSGLLVELDRNTAQFGWDSAVNQFMNNLVTDVHLHGEATIPNKGPLMVVCNHPAAYDVAILAASIHRDDLKIMGSDIPIVQMLPNIAEHFIPVPYHIPSRLQTVRNTIQHLKNEGAILIFPRGNVEPDPDVSPGAEQSLSGWSPSIELFLRRVPQTISVVAIASGMLSGKWFKNPLINIWKKYEQRQKVAEIFQIAAQLFTGKRPTTTPMVSFSAPLTIADLGGEGAADGALLAGLTAQARRLLVDHPRL
jgi:hypothetical protein